MDVGRDDASTDRLPLALSLPAGTVAGGSLLEEEADTFAGHDTLLHGETLLVISSRDLEDVSLELIAKHVTLYFLVHALVVEFAPDSHK